MPRRGYKTITIREEVYNHLYQQYQRNREKLLKQGVTSFSGFIIKTLYEALERQEENS